MAEATGLEPARLFKPKSLANSLITNYHTLPYLLF